MKTFRDNTSREWPVSINVHAIRRVRDATAVNLVSRDFPALLEQLLSDPVLLCDVIYVLCKPEADALNIAAEAFGKAMSGDSVEEAMKAFFDELADFTPNPRARARVKTVVEKLWTMAEKAQDLADAELTAALAKETPTSGPPSTRSPESLASTQAPTP